MGDLLVVDSLARTRTLQDLAREHGVQVLACPGELRRMTGRGEGPAFEAAWEWEPARARARRELRAAAESADRVLLATDPDARGELRAWHLGAALEPRPVQRVWLDALTPEALAEALAAAQPLDGRLVEAELTRLVGFGLVARALEPFGGTGAAASWAACLLLQQVAEREARVSAWRPEPGERLRARLRSPTGHPLVAELVGCVRPAQSDAVREALAPAEWRVSRVRALRAPGPTDGGVSALVLEAERRLRFPSARTLEIARRLYEGKPLGEGASTGLITWHLSPGGPRPTDPTREPGDAAHLAQDESTLYGLILEADRAKRDPPRARASRLAIEAGDWRFEAHWPEDAGRPAASGLRRGALLQLDDLELVPPEESTPPRLSEAEAVETLLGLGAASAEEVPRLVGELEEAGLLVRRGVHLHPSRHGQRLLERVGAERPGLLEATPARDFARAVAGVAAGRHGRAAVLAPFERWLRRAEPPPPPQKPAPVPRRSASGLGLRCPRCARGEIVERRKRGGPLPFYACDRYPQCRFTSSAMPVAGPCPSCGAPLLRARARRTFCVEPGCGWSRRGAGRL